jgi:hypothetical protein
MIEVLMLKMVFWFSVSSFLDDFRFACRMSVNLLSFIATFVAYIFCSPFVFLNCGRTVLVPVFVPGVRGSCVGESNRL